MEHLLLVSPLYLPHALGHSDSLSPSFCLFSTNRFLPSFAAVSVAGTATPQWRRWHCQYGFLAVVGVQPRSVNPFCLVRLLLVRRCWPRLCLQGHDAHVLCCPRFWGHLFARVSVLIYFLTLQWSRQFKCGGPFCNVRLGCLLPYWA